MQRIMHKITIAKEFSETPGPRSKEEGDFSGEEFLERILRPAYERAVAEDETLLIDLDGTEGYATSFLESTFGGLARVFPAEEILSRMIFKCDDEPYLIDEVKKYMRDARE
jgi:hypothetical protein